MRKIYETIGVGVNLQTHLKLEDGQVLLIRFAGGTRNTRLKKRGRYFTSDKKIQKALEKRGDFGVLYDLIDSVPDTLEEAVKPILEDVPEVPVAEADDTKEEPVTQEAPVASGPRVVEDIKTIQAAKEWLIANIEEVGPSHVRNRTAVLDQASKAGVIFPNLPEVK